MSPKTSHGRILSETHVTIQPVSSRLCWSDRIGLLDGCRSPLREDPLGEPRSCSPAMSWMGRGQDARLGLASPPKSSCSPKQTQHLRQLRISAACSPYSFRLLSATDSSLVCLTIVLRLSCASCASGVRRLLRVCAKRLFDERGRHPRASTASVRSLWQRGGMVRRPLGPVGGLGPVGIHALREVDVDHSFRLQPLQLHKLICVEDAVRLGPLNEAPDLH